MVTATQIMEAAHIGNIKTLTRWHKARIIPEPLIQTSPSGRGKAGYWPDWVLDRCVRIMELQRQGHALRSAVALLEAERVSKWINGALARPGIGEKPITTPSGKETNLGEIFNALVARELKTVTHPDVYQQILTGLRKEATLTSLDVAIGLLSNGYSPVVFYDGTDGSVRVCPDFLVSQRLSGISRQGKPCLAFPLFSHIKAFFRAIGKELPLEPTVLPAPIIWAKQGDAMVEMKFYPGGPTGFELIRETSRTIGDLGPGVRSE